jgi:TctA family transporter
MLLVTPYCWPYDQLLLVVPIVTITMCLAKKGGRYLPVALIFFAVDILAWMLFGLALVINKDIWTMLVPLFTFGLLIGYLALNRTIDQSGYRRQN